MRNGIAPESSQPPVAWSAGENVRWKADLPGRGHSSPIVVGDCVILTTASEEDASQRVLAYDRDSGRLLWEVKVNENGLPGSLHTKNTHASPTLACDGERLFATFFHHEQIHVTALDLEGEHLWHVEVSPFRPRRFEYGYAPSPVLYRGMLILAVEYDGDSRLVALDRQDGRQLWGTSRPNNISYSSPVVAHVAGRDQLLISGADQVCSYDPNTGKLLWSTAATTAATCGTVVWDGEMVFASGGYPKSETVAIRGDGSGQVVWRVNQKCYEQSMLAHDGYLYALVDNGVLFCWRAADGREMWKQRLGGPVSASPILAGGHIYWANELGMLFVFRPDPDGLQLIAKNQLGDESFASPAVSGNRLFLRVADSSMGARQESLYCLESAEKRVAQRP